MSQIAYWLESPKCEYPKKIGPDVSILAGPLSKADKDPTRIRQARNFVNTKVQNELHKFLVL